MNLDRFDRLALPVPPQFEAALGYSGETRYVAFYWIPAGDELIYTDGRTSADGNYAPWLLWARHLSVAPTLFGYDFGSSEAEAPHWLLLDREARCFSVGSAREVERFLAALPEHAEERARWEALDPDERAQLTEEALEHLNTAMQQFTPPTATEIEQRMREDQGVYRKLALWLDQQPVTCPACGQGYPAATWNGNDQACPRCGKLYWAEWVARAGK